jgi:hypothetical protein
MNRRFFKKSDLLLLLGILAAGAAVWAFFAFFSAEDGLEAQIYVDSKLVETVDLEHPAERVFSPKGMEDVVRFHVYADGKIGFEAADCPDQICVRTGLLSRAGESAVCLPNGVVLKIVTKNGDWDKEADIIQ